MDTTRLKNGRMQGRPRGVDTPIAHFIFLVRSCQKPRQNNTKTMLFDGRGTTLAARWQHRESTDIDLFFMDVSDRELDQIFRTFLADQRFIQGLFYGRHGFEGKFNDIPFSFIRTSRYSEQHKSEDTTNGIGTESTLEILSKKLKGRLIANMSYPIRDMYDFAVGYMQSSKTVQQAFRSLDDTSKRMVIDASDGFLIDRRRPIINAAYPVLQSSVVLRDIVQHIMRYDFEKAQTQIDLALVANEGFSGGR